LLRGIAVVQALALATKNATTMKRGTAMSETAPAPQSGSNELLAEVRRMVLETEGSLDPEAVSRSARVLCSAFRALDSRLSAEGEWPTAWCGDGWTDIGVWHGDVPVPVGVVGGSHMIDGGDVYDVCPESMSATHVHAEDSYSAEAAAIAEMRSTLS
jgi:hypothetical protein